MKLSLILFYILSVINSSEMLNITQNNQKTVEPNYYNKTIENPTSNFFIPSLKNCYRCSFATNNVIDTNTLFNEKCANKIISCDNTVCSTMLSRDKYDDKYILELGCVSENYCSKITEQNTQYLKDLTDNYVTCCNNDLCNDNNAVNRIIPFYLVTNNTHLINNLAPVNQTINHEDVISDLLYDFSLTENYLKNSCIHELFFTNQDNLIISLKKYDCNDKLINIIPEDSLPAVPAQPIEKIVFLDKNNNTITDLIYSDVGITSVNYIKNKNLLCFISNNNVFIYKIDENKQLKKISQLYLQNTPIDIAINYNAKVIAVTNKNTVYFYNIENIEQTKEFITVEKQITGSNIYKLQYTPNRDVLLVKSYNYNYVFSDLYSLKNMHEIIHIGNRAIQKRRNKGTNKVENIKYNPYKLDFYYGKSAISPINNIIVTNELYYKTLSETDYYQLGAFRGYIWHCKKNTNSCYTKYDKKIVLSDDGMFHLKQYAPFKIQFKGNYMGYYYNIIINILEYFFTTYNKSVMAFIILRSEGEKYIFLKQILDKVDNGNSWSGYVFSHAKIITTKKIFKNSRSGLFNNGSTKIAVFGNNRIQIYKVNLTEYSQPKIQTTKAVQIKSTKQKTNATIIPAIKTTSLKLLFQSSKKNISPININTTKKEYNNFVDKCYKFTNKNHDTIVILGTALISTTTCVAVIYCIIKYIKLRKNSKQKTNNKFMQLYLQKSMSYHNKAIEIDTK